MNLFTYPDLRLRWKQVVDGRSVPGHRRRLGFQISNRWYKINDYAPTRMSWHIYCKFILSNMNYEDAGLLPDGVGGAMGGDELLSTWLPLTLSMRLIDVVTCDGDLNFLRCAAARLEHNERAVDGRERVRSGEIERVVEQQERAANARRAPRALYSNRHFFIRMCFKSQIYQIEALHELVDNF